MVNHELCPKYEKAIKLLGKKWTGLIIYTLLNGPKRFSDISESITSVSAKVLIERFRELEEEGIIVRNVYPEIPVRIEYELTEKGKSFEPVLEEIKKWAEKWVEL
ncbi:MAG: HxlR family transcriptional regulator [Clostridiales bacterium GWB2_37_7]|nr:MAG: HxlR family transcriptional regulator [Clostridiales bacterium GWB2_37_7]